MKEFLKAVTLGVSLNLANRFCGIFYNYNDNSSLFIALVVFYIIITLFLISKDIKSMLLTGFGGFFVMLFSELFVFGHIHTPSIDVYLMGLVASFFSVCTGAILTLKGVRLPSFINSREISVSPKIYGKLLIYFGVTATLFPYLVLPENAGISVPIFAIAQFISLWFTVPDRKRLVLFIPIFIMSLNCFISANRIWLASNYIIAVVLYCAMFVKLDIKQDSFCFLYDTIASVATPLTHFKVPFAGLCKLTAHNNQIIKRIIIALVIALPCILLLIGMLQSADMVFSMKADLFFEEISKLLDFNVIVKCITGIIAALFCFGAVYNAYGKEASKEEKAPRFKGDLIIINIVLSAILIVYTIFVIIQFKYLFGGGALPQGLTYTEYARKGFFELLTLTGINLAVILTVVKLTKQLSGNWLIFTKALCHYLCAVTVVLLVSSYYKMSLYIADDGFTRLRLYVVCFLLFEAIGLLITFIYIAKPRFNLPLVCILIALVYYSVLNIMPADYIIAQNQIDRYMAGSRENIDYVFTLSADVVPLLKELKENTTDKEILTEIDCFLEYTAFTDIPKRWQRFKLSDIY